MTRERLILAVGLLLGTLVAILGLILRYPTAWWSGIVFLALSLGWLIWKFKQLNLNSLKSLNSFIYKLFALVFGFLFVSYSISIMVLLWFMIDTFHDGLENQQQKKYELAIKNYDVVIDHSKRELPGLDLITSVLDLGFSADTAEISNYRPSQNHDAEPVSFYGYQYHRDTISDTNIIISAYNNIGNSNIYITTKIV